MKQKDLTNHYIGKYEYDNQMAENQLAGCGRIMLCFIVAFILCAIVTVISMKTY